MTIIRPDGLQPKEELEDYVNHTRLFPPSPRDPLEVLWELIHVGKHHRDEGRNPLLWVRNELEYLTRQMCPFCGRVTEHEDEEHRFKPARR